MPKLTFSILACLCTIIAWGQAPGTALYDLVKSFANDSTGYENVGSWAVGQTKKFPVKWKSDRLEMSDDTSINFYRTGTAEIVLKGLSSRPAEKPVLWNVMLKGPRMGYTSFSLLSSAYANIAPKATIDSLFGKKPFIAKLLKSCDDNNLSGYYYYQLKLPKKDVLFVKISWLTLNGKTAIRVDGYDDWSKYAVKLDCR